MKSFIIADTRDPFVADIATRMIMDDDRDLELLATANNIDKIHTLMANNTPDLLVISKDIADEQEDWNYGKCAVVTYAINQEDCDDLRSRGLKCYGVVRNANQLLNLIEGPIPKEKQEKPQVTKIIKEKRADFEDLPSDDDIDEMEESEYWQRKNLSEQNDRQSRQPAEPREQERRSYERDYRRERQEYDLANSRPRTERDARNSRPEYDSASRKKGYRDYEDGEPEEPILNRRYSNNYEDEQDYHRYESEPRAAYRKSERDYAERYESERNREAPINRSAKKDLRREKEPLPQVERYYGDKSAEMRYEKDMIRSREKKTTTVTIYAAKGGVGKSTIATQTAVCLALTSGGRDKYRVCIVDYNIDFGDVRPMLGMNNDGPDMYYWAMDIKDRIKAGEDPNEIWYSRSEIEEYLQIMNRIGLYVLCAPNSHQESMSIESIELEIMLRNIIKKGGFDFVVCDTGNNTRDSSIIALEAADYVMLVATQDVTAASCNASVIEALDRFGLDMHKVRLIVNNILSVKYTGINVESVESYFVQYPCIARIRHNLDIVKSNNLNEPIVLQANHEVTKEFRKIVAFLTGTGKTEQEEKKGFRIFRRNRKG